MPLNFGAYQMVCIYLVYQDLALYDLYFYAYVGNITILIDCWYKKMYIRYSTIVIYVGTANTTSESSFRKEYLYRLSFSIG